MHGIELYHICKCRGEAVQWSVSIAHLAHGGVWEHRKRYFKTEEGRILCMISFQDQFVREWCVTLLSAVYI